MTKPRGDTDWEAELAEDEKAVRKQDSKEIPVVLLAGLQRLAREAGIQTSTCSVQTHVAGQNFLVQAVYTVEFSDGTTWVGTADCSTKNTEAPFSNYPTAIAESRAEARCLKKALGIRILANEEIGFQEGVTTIEASPQGRIDSQAVKAIEILCDSRGVDVVAVIEAVVDSPERANSIFQLNELTVAEGRAAMAWLNEQSVSKKPKKPSATEKRDARKKELEGKV